MCRETDEVLYAIANEVNLQAVIYLVDVDEVSDFNAKYELYDPCALMVFFQNKTITNDFGNGPSSAYIRPLTDCQWAVDWIEHMHKHVKSGHGNAVKFERKAPDVRK